MKKIYIRPQTEGFSLDATIPLLTLSEGENASIGIYTDDNQPAENSLIKENQFDFEWD